jgi:alkylation response protein AidB-like acyl-CoA dehydrogenase
MDFTIPADVSADIDRFEEFVKIRLQSDLPSWNRQRKLPSEFFRLMGESGWYGLEENKGRLTRKSALRESVIAEKLAMLSPGVAIAALAHVDLGLMGLFLFGGEDLHRKYGASAAAGRAIMCLGNTENIAGSDVAGISMTAGKVEGGWLLNGTKAYVTNGSIADLAVVTAVSDPPAARNRRLSMYLVDLDVGGIRRTKLNKAVWIPSDLTRLQLNDVFVPDDHLLGTRGRGLQQVLEIFTNSRVPIAALTLGTAVGAFDLALGHMQKRTVFGKKILDFQAKAFETADLYAKIEAARLMVHKAAWALDRGENFRQLSSLAKYLTVEAARETAIWATDIFGAASVVQDHPIHKYPMDVWAASLGEGTQDVQKLIIFRELMNHYRDGR